MNSLFLLNLFMKKILIIGGGAMGSAFSVPCIDNNNKVFITEPHSQRFITVSYTHLTLPTNREV